MLLVSGAVWWGLGQGSEARAPLIALHGLAAMLMLLALGAVAVLHVRESWRRRSNRWSGAIVATAMTVLVITAFVLYYAGSEALRSVASDLHLLVGIGLPVVLVIHIVAGIRSRPPLDDDDWQ